MARSPKSIFGFSVAICAEIILIISVKVKDEAVFGFVGIGFARG